MKKYIIALFIVMSSVTSCMFENDMDYPLVDSDILAFNVEGQKTVSIDESSRQVHIVLEETADIRNVRILSVELSESAKIVGDLPEYIDFTDTLCLNVKVYEDAIWKVYATQPILRYVKVENQIGDAEIDLQTGNIIVYDKNDKINGLITKYDIIDGQQRITTFSLTLLALYTLSFSMGVDVNDKTLNKIKEYFQK